MRASFTLNTFQVIKFKIKPQNKKNDKTQIPIRHFYFTLRLCMMHSSIITLLAQFFVLVTVTKHYAANASYLPVLPQLLLGNKYYDNELFEIFR